MLQPLRFLVYSNLWIGLGAATLTWQYYLLTNQEINQSVILLAFFATMLTYTFQRYVKLINKSRAGGDRIEWMERNPLLVKAIMILSTAGCVHALLDISMVSFGILVLTGAMSLFYVVKIPGKVGKNLRDIPSLKIFLIAYRIVDNNTFEILNTIDKDIKDYPQQHQ
jgi:hypothetical protein